MKAQNEQRTSWSTQSSGKIGTVGAVVVEVGRVTSFVVLGVASLVTMVLGVASLVTVVLGVASLVTVVLGVACLVTMVLGVASLVIMVIGVASLVTVVLGVASLVTMVLGVASLVIVVVWSGGLVAGGPVVDGVVLSVVSSGKRSHVLHDTGQFILIQSEFKSHSSVKAQNEHNKS